MNLKLKITKRYKLEDNDFGDFSDSEILHCIYEFLCKEEFKSISLYNNCLEFKGNRNKLKRHFNWFKTDRVGHLIDLGIVTICSSNNKRKVIYSFQIGRYFIDSLLGLIIIPAIFGIISWSFDVALYFFYLILGFEVLYTIFLILMHPTTVTIPLDFLKFDSNKNKI